MGLMMLFDVGDLIPMWILLVAAIGLTVWETVEQGFNRSVAIWWILFVSLTHVAGYIVLRLWLALAARREGAST